jgi:hypothetical protein
VVGIRKSTSATTIAAASAATVTGERMATIARPTTGISTHALPAMSCGRGRQGSGAGLLSGERMFGYTPVQP